MAHHVFGQEMGEGDSAHIRQHLRGIDYGDRFAQYRADVPYALPRLPKDRPDAQ